MSMAIVMWLVLESMVETKTRLMLMILVIQVHLMQDWMEELLLQVVHLLAPSKDFSIIKWQLS